MKNKLTVIDLFSGCGGLSEGILQTKMFDTIAHVEWELPMVKTLRNRLVKKWNHTIEDAQKRVIHFDIQKTDELISGNWSEKSKENYANNNHESIINKGLEGLIGNKKIDVIVGGPPCQAYSIHGRATDSSSMVEDYRNFLFESFSKIVANFKPEVFVFENVPGILSAKPGGISITERIYKEFDKIGYTITKPSEMSSTVFECSDFKVAQNRKRVLIFGVKKDSDLNLEDFYENMNEQKSKNKKLTIRDAIGDLPKFKPLVKAIKKQGKNVSHISTENNISQHICRYNNQRDISIFKEWVEKKMNYVSSKEKIKFYYQKTGKNTLYSKYRNLEWDKQSYTIVAHLQKDGLMFIHPDSKQARSITIREAALLMSFPIDYDFIGSNGYCYKMIGNAVPVNLAKAIGQSIYDLISNKELKKV
ncbi:DNA cytosine methyltransferase [Tenacibaculum dicentrarchi]|nr:DNA cytosine methyltransferase [Tenacibaculum dicentrarchi]